jgi:HK97 family phage prohead protease
MKSLEKRAINVDLSNVQVNDTEGAKYITGIIPYNSKSQRMFLGYCGSDYEVISPTAFNKTLADKAEVYANFAHDDLAIFGNTRSGTLELTNTENGLICRCKLPDSDIGKRAFETVNRGDCRQMSFEFVPYNWIENCDYNGNGFLHKN